MEDANEDLSWEEKYKQAEVQIQKFRTQAGKVREMLNEKVELTYNVYFDNNNNNNNCALFVQGDSVSLQHAIEEHPVFKANKSQRIYHLNSYYYVKVYGKFCLKAKSIFDLLNNILQ